MIEENIVRTLAALGERSRLRIVQILMEAGNDGIHSAKIAEILGVSASKVAFHLLKLRYSGLLRSRNEGRFVFYSVNVEALDELRMSLDNQFGPNKSPVQRAKSGKGGLPQPKSTAKPPIVVLAKKKPQKKLKIDVPSHRLS